MPGTGFEPAHRFQRYHLKVVRLPISPPGPKGTAKVTGSVCLSSTILCGFFIFLVADFTVVAHERRFFTADLAEPIPAQK